MLDFPVPDDGVEIPIFVATDFGHLTYSTFINGAPAIRIDPRLLENPGLSRFALTHEYGHHRLGHVTDPDSRLSEEQEADAFCWAVEILAIAGDNQAIDLGIAHLAALIEDQDDRRRLGEIEACGDFLS